MSVEAIKIIVTWLSRYWICGLLTLMLLDTVNWMMNKATSSERFTNGERVVIFLLWPVTLGVFVFVFILNAIRRNGQ